MKGDYLISDDVEMRLLSILKTSLLTNQVLCHVEVFPHTLGFSGCIPLVVFESLYSAFAVKCHLPLKAVLIL